MIDYARLGRSVDFYRTLDNPFMPIEVPWTVATAIADITKPEGRTNFVIEGKSKALVASGEQGFLYLALKGFLPDGRYQAITPCFRDEPFDVTHTKYFMKNELIIVAKDQSRIQLEFALQGLVRNAQEFFERETTLPVSLSTAGPTEEIDIFVNGHEVGSYGIRSTSFLTWIYGTGLAEPRFSMACQT